MIIYVLLVGCYSSTKIPQQDDSIDTVTDADGDGYVSTEDCNDEDPYTYSGATELCDGIDNDCDGDVDENVLLEFYEDSDNDGFGNPDSLMAGCEATPGFVSNGNDCMDSDPLIYPGAAEICDGLDNNCNNDIDEGIGDSYYEDLDGDGFGSDVTQRYCEEKDGWVSQTGDCSDEDILVYPLAEEICDDIDNDCDGEVDENIGDVYYVDADSDGFGSASSVLACELNEGYAVNNHDCDDTDSAIYPGAEELCDYIDNDCDGVIDEDVWSAMMWYLDSDGDGHGDPANGSESCAQPAGYVSSSLDCNDNDASISPNALEICDSIDNDCDGGVDNQAVDADLWYLDSDGDQFGDSSQTMTDCSQPGGYILSGGDCNDSNAQVNPDSDELCNNLDDNCDGVIDEDSAIDAEMWFLDSDGDLFGDENQLVTACVSPSGYVDEAGDCDDSNAAINPDAVEICDGVDNNCSGVPDGGIAGLDPTCPALSCQDILDQNPSSTDGVYWIDPQGSGSYEAYCNMNANGGGWTLLLKTTGISNTHFYYSDPLWQNNTLLNQSSVDTSNQNAKLQPFIDLDIEELYGCFPSQNGHCIYADLGAAQTAKDLFSAGMVQIGSGFNNQMYSGWSHQYNCAFFGINSTFSGLRVRFGFSANQEYNCNSNDTAIGLGLGYPNTYYHQYNYGSGQVCAWNGCSLSDFIDEGFPALLFGR